MFRFWFTGFSLEEIIGFDESNFYIEDPGNYTYEQIGSKKITACTTGHEKVRVSCLFSASASGHKMPVICLIKRKTPIIGLQVPNNVIIVYSTTGAL